MGKINKALEKYDAEVEQSRNTGAVTATREVVPGEAKVRRWPKKPVALQNRRGEAENSNETAEAVDHSPRPQKVSASHETINRQRLQKDPKANKAEKPDANLIPRQSPQNKGQRIDGDLISLHAPYSREAELFRALRNKILFPKDGRACRSVMVTSAASGEGKSFVAANLAVNLARNIDHHVLLMDCDLRAPCVHQKFGFGPVKGLSDYLTNGHSLQSLLLKTDVDKLTLLPAGTPPDNPAEILSSARMACLLDEVMARYPDRYIIIDAPPPLIVPDTSAVMNKVDGVLLVVKHGQTNYHLIEALIEEIGPDKIIGAFINQCKMRSSQKYGYSRYNRYGKKA